MEFDHLMRCYLMARRTGSAFFVANALEALAEHLINEDYREQLISDNPDTLGKLMSQLTDGTFGALSGDFGTIHSELLVNNDYDLVLADFSSYMRAYNELCDVYGDQQRWNEMSLHNIANSGWFSSDRTIREYTRDIWHA
jgi:starch phosphorylase